MAISGIELRYLVNHISSKIEGYYVSNIYGVTNDAILFKLHHPERPDIFLMVSTFGLWTTSKKIEQIEPNKLVKRLRSDLLRLRLTEISQPGAERIAYLHFAGFDKEFVLVGEFFSEGNIILCSKDMKILALQHSMEVRHRKLAVGLIYTLPPQTEIDIFNLNRKDIEQIRSSDLQAARWVGRNLGLPRKYVDEIFVQSQIDPKSAGRNLTDDQIDTILNITNTIVKDITSGNHTPIISKDEKGQNEVVPLKLKNITDEKEYTTTDSFEEGLDQIFTEHILQRGKNIHTSQTEKKIEELENQLKEQKNAISLVLEKSTKISNVANEIFRLVSSGITSIEDPRAAKALSKMDSQVTKEKGITYLAVGDENIPINTKSSLPAIASLLFDESKHQKAATTSIERQMKKTQKQIDKLANKSEEEQRNVTFSEVRKKNWFERYRWFFTTDGLLAVGGRDTSSNSAIIRKHVGKNDKVFHADIFGSPFFILKDATEDKITSASLNEAAYATVCFSRAWREAMYGLSAYWVEPEQVKKSAPSGQFLPKGSFTIEGTRNFVKVPTLKLAVGIVEFEDEYLIECGPPEAIRKKCLCCAIIEPTGSEMVDVAKKIRTEFGQRFEDIVRGISIDDFVRVLPAGKSKVVDIEIMANEIRNK